MSRTFPLNSFKFRVEPKDRKTIILGPFSINRFGGDEIGFDMEDGELILFSPELGRGVSMVVPQSVWRQTFDDYMDDYFKKLRDLPGLLKQEFQDALTEIKGYLERRYDGIQPSESRFVEWFIRDYQSPLLYIAATSKFVEKKMEITTWFEPAPEADISPAGVEEALHRYCAWKKAQQDKIYENIYQRQQGSPSSSEPSPVRSEKPQQAVLALYYFYCQETGCLPAFASGGMGMEEDYKRATQPYGLSWKAFQIKYSRLCKSANRLHADNIGNIKEVIPLLEAYPKAKLLAEDELKTAQSKRVTP